MAKQTVNIGTSANKGNGDPLRTAFTKINDNFTELYTSVDSLQSSDADLTAIAALTGTSGFLKKTAANSWALDTNTYTTLTGTETLTNKTINLTSNTITGTLAQFNTALSDANFVSIAGTETLTNKTLTSPKIDLIKDANDNEVLGFSATASATDYLVVQNGIGVGSPLHIYAAGDSANIGVHLQPKGTGIFTISDGTDFNKGIRFRSSSSAASTITLIDAVSTAGRVLTLPDATDTLVGRATTDTLTNKTAGIATSSSTASSLGYLGIPQSGTATTATLAIGDAGKHIYVTTAGQTITIPANASVAYPIGTTIGFIAGPSATTVTIAITSDTMYLGGTGTTGSRTLAAHGMATAVKVAATTWYISGNGLT